MPKTNPATPLSALDAVVLDTETTGLDVRIARIVQIGAVRIHGTEVRDGETFERLVDPGIPIPASTTAIHGIADADVRGRPTIAAVLPDLEAFVGAAIVVGHTIDYDLTILDRAARDAGRTPRTWRALDVRLLAEAGGLPIAQYDLDRIAGTLDVPIAGRHTALGDALTTARIFAALVPVLRQRGIRTLAEAEAASRICRQRSTVTIPTTLDDRATGAHLPAIDPLAAVARVDSFAFVHRVGDVMSTPPVWVPAQTHVGAAIGAMMGQRVSSVLVRDTSGAAGIATERDMLRAIDAHGAAALAMPIGPLATRPLATVAADDFVYRAIGRMDRRSIRHLVVTGADGDVVGMVSSRALLRHRASTALMLGDAIEEAADARALARAWSSVPVAARSLLAEGVAARDVAAVISAELCAVTRQAATIAERRMKAAGKGDPPVPYALLVLGSAGRGESLLAADQDNAIVFAEGAPGGLADTWFAELATDIAATLDAAGIPFCTGGVMAKTALWRHALPEFEALVAQWVRRQRPEDVLNVDIFFDGIPVHGDLAMGERLFATAHAAASRSVTFQKQLTVLTSTWRLPITLFGNLRAELDSRVDLKKHGLLPIFTAARVLALRIADRARSTPGRLRAYAGTRADSAEAVERLIAAHAAILAAILEQQLVDGAAGVRLSPRVDVTRLTAERRAELKGAIREVATAVDLVSEGRLV